MRSTMTTPDAKVREMTERRNLLSSAFTPSAPIDSERLFSGRVEQLARVIDVVDERGQHGALYGDRGVGKTSLANIVASFRLGPDIAVVKVSCGDSPDTFKGLWQRILGKLTVPLRRQRVGFAAGDDVAYIKLTEALKINRVTAGDIVSLFTDLKAGCFIVIDEFDRITESRTKDMFAETLKGFSDSCPGVTILIVGVAQDIAHLIGHHPSLTRCLKQIRIPRMSEDELAQILSTGSDILNMTFTADVSRRIIHLSNGYPNYTHLLGKYAAQNAIVRKSTEVTSADLEAAMDEAVSDAEEPCRRRRRPCPGATCGGGRPCSAVAPRSRRRGRGACARRAPSRGPAPSCTRGTGGRSSA